MMLHEAMCNITPKYNQNIVDIDDCANNPCQNGATCTDMVNQYNCTCVDGYSGDNCEIGWNVFYFLCAAHFQTIHINKSFKCIMK